MVLDAGSSKILCSQFRNLQLCTSSVDKLVSIPSESLPNTIHVFIQSPRLPRRILVSTLPVSLNCLDHLLMLFLSGSLTPYFYGHAALKQWSQILHITTWSVLYAVW